ncbi:hypothetical protein [Stenomitos frigidus]|nr:hypothetical protein [Stenomitos frigidus]
MRLKASLLVTASCMTLVLVVIGLLHSTAQQAIDAEPIADALAPLLSPLSASKPLANATTTADAVEALLDRPSHSEADTRETLKRRFSVDSSLDRVKQIDQLLADIRIATNPTTAGKRPGAIGGVSLKTQTSAHEWIGSVTGTLKKQDYEIKKLELALAQKQFKDGEIPQAALVEKQASYQKAAREFKTFLNSFRIAD